MGAWWIQAVEMKRLPTLVAARFRRLRVLGVVIDSLDGASPLGDRGRLAKTQGARAASMRVCGWEAVAACLAGATPSGRGSFHSSRTGKQQSNPISGGREVDVVSRQRRKQHRNAARRPWWRPLVGLGLLAGWLAVSKRGRQAVKAAKEQASKARRKLAAARPGGTTTAAPPIGAPPGPVLAEVTELPQDNDSGDGKSGPKPDTQTETAKAEPPTNQ